MAIYPSIMITVSPIAGGTKPMWAAQAMLVNADTTEDSVTELAGWQTGAFWTTYAAQPTSQRALVAIINAVALQLTGMMGDGEDVPLETRKAVAEFVEGAKKVHGMDALFPL